MRVSFYVFCVCRWYVLCHAAGLQSAEGVITAHIVSTSDVTPTERWLNVWCIWHSFLETLQECRSRHLTSLIKPDFWETRVSRLFSVRRETKMPWPNLLTKEESHRVYKCDDERLSGSTKRWIFKSMWNI